jgi:hypothetical protein
VVASARRGCSPAALPISQPTKVAHTTSGRTGRPGQWTCAQLRLRTRRLYTCLDEPANALSLAGYRLTRSAATFRVEDVASIAVVVRPGWLTAIGTVAVAVVAVGVALFAEWRAGVLAGLWADGQ